MDHIITFRKGSQQRYISCIIFGTPREIAYSSSERSVDAVRLPDAVADGIRDMLNWRWSLGAVLDDPRG